MVIEAADAVNLALAEAPIASIEELLAGPHASIVRRWLHREEHIEQIRRALR